VLDLGNVCIVRIVDRGDEAMPVNVLFLVRPPPAYRELVCVYETTMCTRFCLLTIYVEILVFSM